MGARVPDGQLFPTATAQIVLRKVLVSDVLGNGAWAFNPMDVLTNISVTATSGLIKTYTVSPGRVITAVTNYTVAEWAGNPQLQALWSQIDEARIVSACIEGEYMGTTSNDSGVVTAAVMPGDMAFSTVAGPQGVAAYDSFAAFSGAITLPVRAGFSARWYPAVKEDLLFRDAITSGAGLTGYSSGAAGVNTVASSVGVFMTGGIAAATNIFNVTFTINVEFVPVIGVAAGSQDVGGDHPGWMTSAGAWARSAANVIVPYALGAMVQRAGVGSMYGALRGNLPRALQF